MKTQVYIFPDAVKHVNNNSLEIKKIRFSDTSYKKLCQEATAEFKKDTFTYFIDMYYKNKPLIIQLPKYKIRELSDNKMILDINEDLFQYLISPLEEHIIQNIYDNSEKWFNGKRFTMNKIMNSLISPCHKSNTGYTLKLSLNKNTLYFNRYKHVIQHNDISLGEDVDILCLIKLSNLQFLQNKFSYNIILEQAKVFMEDRLIEYSIIDDPDGKISESISVSEECDGEYYQEHSIDSSKRDFF